MTLTWTLGSDVEPDPASWAALLPPERAPKPAADPQKPRRKLTRGHPDDPTTEIGAVLAAVRAGFTKTPEIAIATGQTSYQVGFRLASLGRMGRVVCTGRGTNARWVLA